MQSKPVSGPRLVKHINVICHVQPCASIHLSLLYSFAANSMNANLVLLILPHGKPASPFKLLAMIESTSASEAGTYITYPERGQIRSTYGIENFIRFLMASAQGAEILYPQCLFLH